MRTNNTYGLDINFFLIDFPLLCCLRFSDDTHLTRIIQKIVSAVGRRVEYRIAGARRSSSVEQFKQAITLHIFMIARIYRSLATAQ